MRQKPKHLWGLRVIGDYIERNPRQTHYLVASGKLRCVKKIGGVYHSTDEALDRELGAVEQEQVAS